MEPQSEIKIVKNIGEIRFGGRVFVNVVSLRYIGMIDINVGEMCFIPMNVHNELFNGVRQLRWQHLSPVVSTLCSYQAVIRLFHIALHPPFLSLSAHMSLSLCPYVSLSLFLWYPIPFAIASRFPN